MLFPAYEYGYANNNNKRGIMLAFIKAVLKFFGFSTKLINWIMTLLKDFTVEIVQAGNISKSINIGRGCRQGDPIASLLFILCIEILLIIKSRIRETKHLSTYADSSTDAIRGWTKNTPKPNFKKRKMSRDMPKLEIRPLTRGL